jgi:hypothetical protein
MIDDHLIHDVFVRDDDNRVVLGADAGRAQRDPVHAPVLAPHGDVVTDREGFVPEDDEPRDRVGERVLRREPDRDPRDPDPGESRAHVDAELARRHDDGEHEHDEPVDVIDEQRDERLVECRAGENAAKWALRPPVADPEEEKDEDRHGEARKKGDRVRGQLRNVELAHQLVQNHPPVRDRILPAPPPRSN